MFYSEELVEEIREKNDIVDVIGSFVGLKRAGNSYMCCCPFHNEKTPSFHVSRTKQIYHCFGCGVGGNVITFLMQYENYTFAEALKYLADRAGIPLPENEMSPEQKKVENRRELLREVSKSAAAYYHYILTKTENGIKGRDYFMEKRGFTEETIANFGLGYADKYSDGLYKYLKSRGYSDDLMRDSGLVNFTEKYGAQDIFWNRVMVPITDIGGKVIAFGGRVLGDAKPKYLNTKETDIFNKRRNLFAMNIAKRSRRRGIILCEGYMDVISMHQAGFDNAVASLGTAFTEEQILRNADMTQRVIDMSPYKDPDEFIKALGAEEYEQRIKDAKPGLLFETELLAKEYKQNDPEERTEFIGRVARLLKPIEDPVRMNSYIEIISNKYQIEKEYLRGAVDTTVLVDSRDSSPVNDPGVRDISPDGAAVESQKLLLTWMVNEPELFKKLENVISVEDFTDDNINAVAKLLYEQYEKQGKVSPAAIIDRFESLESQQVVAAIMNTELPRMLDGNEKNKAFTEIVKRVKSNSIESALKNNKDPQKLMDLIQRKKSLDRLEVNI